MFLGGDTEGNPLNQTLRDFQSPAPQNSDGDAGGSRRRAHFFVYCSSQQCRGLRPGKLRVFPRTPRFTCPSAQELLQNIISPGPLPRLRRGCHNTEQGPAGVEGCPGAWQDHRQVRERQVSSGAAAGVRGQVLLQVRGGAPRKRGRRGGSAARPRQTERRAGEKECIFVSFHLGFFVKYIFLL